jgi:hypothetical protein
MFDRQNGHALCIQAAQHLAGLAGFFRRHPGRGFIQQQKLRLYTHRHSNFQPLLASVRQGACGLFFQSYAGIWVMA